MTLYVFCDALGLAVKRFVEGSALYIHSIHDRSVTIQRYLAPLQVLSSSSISELDLCEAPMLQPNLLFVGTMLEHRRQVIFSITLVDSIVRYGRQVIFGIALFGSVFRY